MPTNLEAVFVVHVVVADASMAWPYEVLLGLLDMEPGVGTWSVMIMYFALH